MERAAAKESGSYKKSLLLVAAYERVSTDKEEQKDSDIHDRVACPIENVFTPKGFNCMDFTRVQVFT